MSTDKSTNKLTQIIEAKRQKQLERENKEKWIRDELLKMGFQKESVGTMNYFDHQASEWYIFDSPDYHLCFEIYIEFDCKKAEIYCNYLWLKEDHIGYEYNWLHRPIKEFVFSDTGDAKELLDKIMTSCEKLTPETLFPRNVED